MKKRIYIACFFVLVLAVVSACGKHGGGDGENHHANPTSAVLTLSTQGTTTNIGGLGVTVILPTGVTVKTDSGGNVDPSVVTTSGVAAGQATVLTLYTAATATIHARLNVALSSNALNGFGAGEFATVHCAINSGSPSVSDFSLTDFQLIDATYYAPITGLTATFSAAIQ